MLLREVRTLLIKIEGKSKGMFLGCKGELKRILREIPLEFQRKLSDTLWNLKKLKRNPSDPTGNR